MSYSCVRTVINMRYSLATVITGNYRLWLIVPLTHVVQSNVVVLCVNDMEKAEHVSFNWF